MEFEPTTLPDLAGCSNRWATETLVSKSEMWAVDWNCIARLHSQIITWQSSISQEYSKGIQLVPSMEVCFNKCYYIFLASILFHSFYHLSTHLSSKNKHGNSLKKYGKIFSLETHRCKRNLKPTWYR